MNLYSSVVAKMASPEKNRDQQNNTRFSSYPKERQEMLLILRFKG